MPHTKGLRVGGDGILAITEEGGVVADFGYGYNAEESRADCRMFIASDALLEALEEITERMCGEQHAEEEIDKSLGRGTGYLFTRARAAIALAKGEK